MTKKARLIIVLLVAALSCVFVYPTIKWYFFTPQELKVQAAGSREDIQRIARTHAAQDFSSLLGTYQQDKSAQLPAEFKYLKGLARTEAKKSGKKVDFDGSIKSIFAAFGTKNTLLDSIEGYYRDDLIEVKTLSNNVVQLGLDLSGGMSVLLEVDEANLAKRLGHEPSTSELSEAVDQVIEILNNRIDQFGLTEPQINKQGSKQISINIPGAVNQERVDSILMGKGSLDFRIVDRDATSKLANYIATQREKAFAEEGKLTIPEGMLPAATEVMGNYVKNEYGVDELDARQPYVVVASEPGLSGDYIESASVSTDSFGKIQVAFSIGLEGGEIFYNFTSAHVGDLLAVVLDGKVKQIATIREPLRSTAAISGSFTTEEANNLVKVFKTGALPVDVQVVYQESIGASLGAETVRLGLLAIVIGFLLVMVFVLIYYRGAGVIADFALLLNLAIIFSVLSAFHFTLTLTGIAGLILTVGMAVDSNVIIFERIKEELRIGKGARAAVHAGYDKALSTIIDANVTTFIAAIVLSQVNSGPIQGFATTLSIGIVVSVFTALFVTRLLFDYFLDEAGVRHISIGEKGAKA